MLFPEAFLQRVELAVLGQTLDRGDLGAVGLDGEDGARLDAPPVDEHRAGAALAGVAADVCAGQVELLAQEVHEEQARLHLRLAHLAVDRHRDLGHVSLAIRVLCRAFGGIIHAACTSNFRTFEL